MSYPLLQRGIRIAMLLVLLCLAALLIAATLLALQMREATADAANRIDALTEQYRVLGVAAQQRVDESKALLVNSGKLLNDARLTLDNVNRAAIDERMYFEQQVPGTMRRVDTLLAGLNDDASGLRATEAAATLTLDTAGETLRGLAPVERNAALTLQDADAVIANPQIPALLTHADATAAASASAANHLDAAAADVQEATHRFLHPGWKTRAANWTAQAVHALGGWL